VNGGAARGRARELAAESHFQRFTRLGFLGRGLLYILIGVLALGTGRTEDVTGAMEYLGHGVGRVLLIAIAVGMATYGLWRLTDAAFAVENPGPSGKALRKRAASAAIGLVYLYLCYKAVRIVFLGRAGTMSPADQARAVIHLPGGTFFLLLAALILVAAAIVQFRKSMKCSFLLQLNHRARAPIPKWLGRLGYAARGVIFLTIAYLVACAARDGRSAEAGGMEQALDFYSGPVLWAVASGLMLFGAFSLVEALFRRIHEPPAPADIKREVEKRLT